ncbi:hypothetical protein O3P69_014082 [Scylla paramamosain]|uniref:Uncharacterized protein n=1 Tax=Scylla paramamosain TaxID=85552 RepID=A0AAW0SR71_SCYPA
MVQPRLDGAKRRLGKDRRQSAVAVTEERQLLPAPSIAKQYQRSTRIRKASPAVPASPQSDLLLLPSQHPPSSALYSCIFVIHPSW